MTGTGALPPSPPKECAVNRLKEKDKRSLTIKFRVTPVEHSKLMACKTTHYLATWCRDRLLENDTVEPRSKRRDVPLVDPRLLRGQAAIGNNLNQIARRLNTRHDLSPQEKLLMLNEMIDLRVAASKVGIL